jgi:DNA-binding NarL/FixJ family response regulator
MFKKVLIAEDMDAINQGVLSILTDLQIAQIDQVQYCDDAYLKIKKGELDKSPYELLITDLSFKNDYRKQNFDSGEELINIVKKEHPKIKIIVYSIEDRFHTVRRLVKTYSIEAYVCKGRKGLAELKKAICETAQDKIYVSPNVAPALNNKTNLSITDYDIELMKQLSLGASQKHISSYFKEHQISPSSLSSIEKNINTLRNQFDAKNVIHLVAIVKDMGII